MRINYIKTNEGFSAKPYRCSEGCLTIGYGINLDAGITEREAEVILLMRLQDVEEHVSGYLFWCQLNEARQTVLVDMCYQLGKTGFSKFKKMIAALDHQDYEEAAIQILDSKYAKQTPNRASKNAQIMSIGSF